MKNFDNYIYYKGEIWLAKTSYKNRGLMITNKKLKEQLKSLIYKVNRK